MNAEMCKSDAATMYIYTCSGTRVVSKNGIEIQYCITVSQHCVYTNEIKFQTFPESKIENQQGFKGE